MLLLTISMYRGIRRWSCGCEVLLFGFIQRIRQRWSPIIFVNSRCFFIGLNWNWAVFLQHNLGDFVWGRLPTPSKTFYFDRLLGFFNKLFTPLKTLKNFGLSTYEITFKRSISKRSFCRTSPLVIISFRSVAFGSRCSMIYVLRQVFTPGSVLFEVESGELNCWLGSM